MDEERVTASAIEEITKLADKAAGVKTTSLDRHTQMVSVNGVHEERPVSTPVRDHRVKDMFSLFQIAEEYASTEFAPIVFYDYTMARVICDHHDYREDGAVYVFESTGEWDEVFGNEGPDNSWVQSEFVKCLKQFSDTDALRPVIQSVREVVFDKSMQTKGMVKSDQESMGRSVNQKVTSTDKIPEKFSAVVPIYKGEDWIPVVLSFDIDINLDHQAFSYSLAAGEEDKLWGLMAEQARTRIGNLMEAASFDGRIVHGMPK